MRRPRSACARWVTVGALLLAPVDAGAHPLHTSVARVHITSSRVVIRLRAFSDDFSAAAARHARSPVLADYRVADGAAHAYVTATLHVLADGKPLELELVGQRRDGDVTWVELHGRVPAGARLTQLHNRLLRDVHADQVNIVQVTVGERKQTLLFAPTDGPKALPMA